MYSKRVYFVLALITFVVASYRPTWERLVWDLFGVAFLIAADKIKDIERAKWKVRETTEIEMRKEINEEFSKSLDNRYDNMIKQIAKAFEISFKQVSTYVKDASPTRTAYRRLPDDRQQRDDDNER